MKLSKGLLLFVLASLFIGCTATGNVSQSYSPQADDKFNYEFVNTDKVEAKALPLFTQRLEQQLNSNGVLATGSAAKTKLVKINFNHYRMRHGASRALVGVFAGTDKIDTTVSVEENGVLIGKFNVKSANASAWGTSRGLIEGHIDKIVKYLVKAQ